MHIILALSAFKSSLLNAYHQIANNAGPFFRISRRSSSMRIFYGLELQILSNGIINHAGPTSSFSPLYLSLALVSTLAAEGVVRFSNLEAKRDGLDQRPVTVTTYWKEQATSKQREV